MSINIKRNQLKRVVIVGGGLGGLRLAEDLCNSNLQGLKEEAKAWADRRSGMIEAFNKQFLTNKAGTSRRPGLRFSFHYFKVYKSVFRFTCCKRTHLYVQALVKAYKCTYK